MGRGGTRTKIITAATACTLALTGLPPATAGAPGVNARRIKIGVHGPVSGAVPLPNDSADQAARLFWRWLRAKGRTINGRHVRVVLRNDQTNPAQAVAVCKEMVEEKRVFALASLPSGLPTQIEACARYAESVNVPYVSLGVTRRFFRGFDRYFAVSANYARQGWLLADLYADSLRAKDKANGLVYLEKPAWREAIRRFKGELERRGVVIDYERSLPGNAGTAEARLIVEEMRLGQIQNVFFAHRPTFFMNVVKQADTQSYRPQWTGIDSGIAHSDELVETTCAGGLSIDGARFLSPIPAFGDRDNFDPSHDRAMQRVYDRAGNMTTWLGWALSKALKRVLDEPGRRLTRPRFERKVERMRFRTGILPKVRFRPDDHFGGRAMHLLRADCSDGRWHTARRFVSDF